MKKLGFVLLSVALVLSLCACGSNAPEDVSVPNGMIYVHNEVIKVSACYPTGWTVDRNDGMLSLMKDTSENPQISTYATVSVTKYQTAAANQGEYWDSYEQRLSEELKDFVSVSEEEIKIGGNTAGKYHYTATVDGNTYHFVQVIAVGGYSAYIITLTASEADYESANEDFEKIISNFYFK